MNREQFSHHGSLMIFSWFTPARLNEQILSLGFVPHNVIWVDPFPSDDVPKSIANAASLTLIKAVLTPTSAKAKLRRYSLPDLHSLTPATRDLNSLFPGLKVSDDISVSTISHESLAQKLGEVDGPLQVIIDTPGAENTIIDFLKNSHLIEKIETIALRCGDGLFFDGAVASNRLLDTLASENFNVVSTNDDDPDWPLYVLKSDQRAGILKALKAETALAHDTVADLTKILQNKDTEIQNALDRLADAETALVKLQAQLGRSEKTLADSMATKEKVERAHKKQSEALDTATAGIVQRDAALTQLRTELRTANARVNEISIRSTHDTSQLQMDLRRAAQSQEKLQIEGDALKTRYTAVEEERQKLRNLLQQLTPRLREAAKHVRDISPARQADGVSGPAGKALKKSKLIKKSEKNHE